MYVFNLMGANVSSSPFSKLLKGLEKSIFLTNWRGWRKGKRQRLEVKGWETSLA